jgi:hypothetical protein
MLRTRAPPGDSTVASDPNAAVIEATINSDIATLDSYIANPVTITVTFEKTINGLADSNSNAYLRRLSWRARNQTEPLGGG